MKNLLERRGGLIKERLLFIFQEAQRENQEGGRWGYWFFMPLSRFAREGAEHGRQKSTWEKTIILLSCLGMIEREIPTDENAITPYRQAALQYAKEHGHERATAFISVPEDTAGQMRYQGDMAYIPMQVMFYLFEQVPQKDVNCYSTVATPCNARITVTRKVDDTVTVDGYLLEKGGIQEIISDIPCIVRHTPAYTTANGTPGMVIGDDVTVTIQRNRFTEMIERGQEVSLKDDAKVYSITDIRTDGNPQTGKGIIRLSCRAIARGITQ